MPLNPLRDTRVPPAARAGQGVALGSLLGSGAEDSVGDAEPLGSGAEDSVADAEALGSVEASDVGPAVAVVGAADDPGAVPVGVGGWVRLSVGDGESPGRTGGHRRRPRAGGGRGAAGGGCRCAHFLDQLPDLVLEGEQPVADLVQRHVLDGSGEGRDLLPQGIQPPVLVSVEVTGHGEDELLGQRIGDAPAQA